MLCFTFLFILPWHGFLCCRFSFLSHHRSLVRRYSPDQTVISDAHGNVSNLLIVEPPRAALAAVMRSTRTAAARASASASFDATGTAATGTATGGPHRFTHRASDVCDDNALAQALHAYLEDEIFNSQRDGAGFDDRDSPSAAAAAANQSARAAEYGQAVPDFEGGAYMKDPPILPPHIGSLQHVLLNANAYQDGSSSSSSLSSSMSASSANANSNASSNSTSSSSSGGNPAGGSSNPPPPQPPQRAHIVRDPYVLPAPQTVALHHLFCASHKKDDVRVMAVTQRYKNKFVTTVVYSQNQRGGSGSRVAVPPT